MACFACLPNVGSGERQGQAGEEEEEIGAFGHKKRRRSSKQGSRQQRLGWLAVSGWKKRGRNSSDRFCDVVGSFFDWRFVT